MKDADALKLFEAMEYIQELHEALKLLVDAVAGEQRDPMELSKALGNAAPYAIDQADMVLERSFAFLEKNA
jgi:hypothetical protein